MSDQPTTTPSPTGAPPPQEQSNEAKRLVALEGALEDPIKIRREQRVVGPTGSPFDGFIRTYQQRKLSVFPRKTWEKMVSDALKRMLSEGTSISEIMRGGLAAMSQGKTADDMLMFVLNLLSEQHDLLIKTYMMSLSIPIDDQQIVQAIWSLPEEEDGSGGLSDADDQAMMITFIRQNAVALEGFYRETLPAVWEEIKSIRDSSQTQGSSKP